MVLCKLTDNRSALGGFGFETHIIPDCSNDDQMTPCQFKQFIINNSSLQQINQDLNIQLLKDGYRLDEIPDDEDLDLIPPKSVNPTCMCCQATSSTTCQIQ